jgi:hypothetical protein
MALRVAEIGIADGLQLLGALLGNQEGLQTTPRYEEHDCQQKAQPSQP